jgi:hypothetical protein
MHIMNKRIFKQISFLLIISILTQDILWAGPDIMLRQRAYVERGAGEESLIFNRKDPGTPKGEPASSSSAAEGESSIVSPELNEAPQPQAEPGATSPQRGSATGEFIYMVMPERFYPIATTYPQGSKVAIPWEFVAKPDKAKDDDMVLVFKNNGVVKVHRKLTSDGIRKIAEAIGWKTDEFSLFSLSMDLRQNETLRDAAEIMLGKSIDADEYSESKLDYNFDIEPPEPIQVIYKGKAYSLEEFKADVAELFKEEISLLSAVAFKGKYLYRAIYTSEWREIQEERVMPIRVETNFEEAIGPQVRGYVNQDGYAGIIIRIPVLGPYFVIKGIGVQRVASFTPHFVKPKILISGVDEPERWVSVEDYMALKKEAPQTQAEPGTGLPRRATGEDLHRGMADTIRVKHSTCIDFVPLMTTYGIFVTTNIPMVARIRTELSYPQKEIFGGREVVLILDIPKELLDLDLSDDVFIQIKRPEQSARLPEELREDLRRRIDRIRTRMWEVEREVGRELSPLEKLELREMAGKAEKLLSYDEQQDDKEAMVKEKLVRFPATFINIEETLKANHGKVSDKVFAELERWLLGYRDALVAKANIVPAIQARGSSGNSGDTILNSASSPAEGLPQQSRNARPDSSTVKEQVENSAPIVSRRARRTDAETAPAETNNERRTTNDGDAPAAAESPAARKKAADEGRSLPAENVKSKDATPNTPEKLERPKTSQEAREGKHIASNI